MDDRPPFGLFQIHCQAALVSAEGCEEAGSESSQSAGVVTLRRRLDLDHVGTSSANINPAVGPITV